MQRCNRVTSGGLRPSTAKPPKQEYSYVLRNLRQEVRDSYFQQPTGQDQLQHCQESYQVIQEASGSLIFLSKTPCFPAEADAKLFHHQANT